MPPPDFLRTGSGLHLSSNRQTGDLSRSKCTGHKKTGEPCGNWPRKGTTVCNYHGGKAPQVRAAAERNIVTDLVRRTAAEIVKDAVPVADPLRALQGLAGRLAAFEEAVAAQVDVLKLGYSSEMGTEQLRAAAGVYMQVLGEQRQLLTAMGRLNIDARLAAIQESTATMIRDAVVATLVAAGITGPAQNEALKIFSRELRVIQGARAGDY